MKHVKLLLALIVVVLIGISTSEIVLAQGKKKPTSKIPVKTEKPATKPAPKATPKQENKPAMKPKQEKKPAARREAEEKPKKTVERKPESKPQPKPAPALNNRTFTVGGVSFTMVEVQGGTFTMGATSDQGSYDWSDLSPAHSVTLSSYYIGETEVTQALWEAVMGSNPSKFKGANRPVEMVSWEDCQEFLSRLNRATGERFRLPTEAEWEYAARGGHSGGYKYSGSGNIDAVAWYCDNSGDKTHPVASKRPNELGLYDMSGNVWEWCQDWFGGISSIAQTNPTGPSSPSLGYSRMVRGGGWVSVAMYCIVSRRPSSPPDFRSDSKGLRLAL